AGHRRELEEVQGRRTALAARAAARDERASQRSRALARAEAARFQASSLEAKVAEEEARSSALLDFSALLRQYVVAVFEAVLSDLSQPTSATLASVPNTADLTVEFRPAERAGRSEIHSRVLISGVERPGDPISGGQEVSVELATDLAFFDVVCGRGE